MQYAESLIDKAIESCGSAAELARKMGIDRAEVKKLKQASRWRGGDVGFFLQRRLDFRYENDS